MFFPFDRVGNLVAFIVILWLAGFAVFCVVAPVRAVYRHVTGKEQLDRAMEKARWEDSKRRMDEYDRTGVWEKAQSESELLRQCREDIRTKRE